MEKINIGKIKEFSNFSNSNEGIVLYKKSKLNMIYYEFTRTGISLWFNVTSTRNIVHKTNISLDEEGNISSFSCSCTYKNIKNDTCKHIVASYVFFINNLKGNLKEKSIYDFSELDKVSLSNKVISLDQQKYKLLYCINIISKNEVRIDLKIELNKTYPILNIQKFLECILSSSTYKINKTTEITLTEQNFKDEDRLFLNTLLNIFSLHDSNSLEDKIFLGQYIILNHRLLQNFMEITNKDGFSIKFGNEYFENRKLVCDDLDISPIISTDQHNNITLDLNISDIINLFEDSNYFYSKGNIYITSDNFVKNYKCLRNLILNNNTSYFTIDESNKNIFLNQIIPKFSRHFNLKIHDLNKGITAENCNPRFYIDKTINDTIIIKPIFNYGELNINPLDTSSLNTYILRDYKKENSILMTLSSFCEQQNSIYYFISSPKKIIEFKDHGIHALKKFGEIYYTKNFKKYKLISSSSYKTSFKINENNLLNISFSFDGITNEELYSAIKNIRRGEKYLKLKDKGILNLDNEYLKEINKILLDLDIDEENLKEDSLKINKFHAFYLEDKYSNNFKSLGELDRNNNFLNITSKFVNRENIDLSPPENLTSSLRNYQLEGFKWLKTLKEYSLSGILADEMGLGKTIQTIAFLQKEFEEGSLKTSIIICPKSLIYNWFDEIKKFAPNLKVLIYSGNKNIRLQLLKTFSMYDVILTSYGMVQKDILQLRNKNFNICIIDEAQSIKNKVSKNTLSLKELNVNHKFALTGTPIENSIDELWSIFDFLMPGYLHSYSKFKSIYESSENHGNLNRKISPFILRRLKKNVLTELPPKIETKIMVDLNNEQKKLYYSYIEKFKTDFENDESINGNRNLKFKILSALTRLRQICCEPKVVLGDYSHGSAKIDILMEILENNIKNNKKIIVFSNFTSVLGIIRELLIKNNIKYTYLDGSTPAKDRIDIVNKFNKDDSNVFLISLKAGGFGLNITSAEIVIHFDPWWNNAVENQATDRAHRIGQKNVIHVIKLITKGTIEEKIFDIQHRKNNLINSIIKDNELDYNLISKISINELKSLFTIDNL